jgi:hypothetical protein
VASKMEPLCNSLALSGPSPIHVGGGPHVVSTAQPRRWVSIMTQCMMARRGTLVDTWWVPGGPRCVGVDETPVVESEGKRSSMGQMVPAGWAVHTVPAGLVQTAPSMLGPWNHPTSHLIKCRGLNIEGAVRARHLILNGPHRAAPRARVFPQSGRKSFVRDCSLHVSPRPVVPSSALRGRFGSRVPRALTP